MNSRERVQAALQFERPDRLPANESPWEQTAAAWYEQGIPAEMSLADYFGFDLAMMYLDTSPRFPMKVLGRGDGLLTYEDRFGYSYGHWTPDEQPYILSVRLKLEELDALAEKRQP